MFISEFSGDVNFGLVSLTILINSTINYITKIVDHFTIRDGDRLLGVESILWYCVQFWHEYFEFALLTSTAFFHIFKSFFSEEKKLSPRKVSLSMVEGKEVELTQMFPVYWHICLINFLMSVWKYEKNLKQNLQNC